MKWRKMVAWFAFDARGHALMVRRIDKADYQWQFVDAMVSGRSRSLRGARRAVERAVKRSERK